MEVRLEMKKMEGGTNLCKHGQTTSQSQELGRQGPCRTFYIITHNPSVYHTCLIASLLHCPDDMHHALLNMLGFQSCLVCGRLGFGSRMCWMCRALPVWESRTVCNILT